MFVECLLGETPPPLTPRARRRPAAGVRLRLVDAAHRGGVQCFDPVELHRPARVLLGRTANSAAGCTTISGRELAEIDCVAAQLLGPLSRRFAGFGGGCRGAITGWRELRPSRRLSVVCQRRRLRPGRMAGALDAAAVMTQLLVARSPPTHRQLHDDFDPFRCSRATNDLALSSPIIASFTGSHFRSRLSRKAMFARWQFESERWCEKTSDIGSLRFFTQSKKFCMWLTVRSSCRP